MLNEGLSPGSLNGLLGGFWRKFVERMWGLSRSSTEDSTMGPKITSEKLWDGRFSGRGRRRVATHRNAPWWENSSVSLEGLVFVGH